MGSIKNPGLSFMTMTTDLDHKSRVKTAKKAVLVAFITIVIFAFSGQLLFNFFGISVNILVCQ